MRFSKRFLVFALLLAFTLFWKLNNWNDRYAAVESFRGAALNKDVLYPLMSKNLNNSGQLKVYINDQLYTNTADYTILDDSLNPVGSLEFIRKELMGSAFMMDDKEALVQVTNDIFFFTKVKNLHTQLTVRWSLRWHLLFIEARCISGFRTCARYLDINTITTLINTLSRFPTTRQLICLRDMTLEL